MASDKTCVTFARDVLLRVSSEDALVLDGQSKICNRLHNDLRDEVAAALAELHIISGYGLSDDPVIQAMASTETRRRVDKVTKEKVEYQLTLSREQQLLNLLFTENGLRDLVPDLKDRHPFLKAVHSSPLKNVARRLNKSLRHWSDSKAGRRKGPKLGFPKYKAWKRDWYSVEYEEPGKGWSVQDGHVLKLSLGVDTEGERLTLELPMVSPPLGLSKAAGVRLVKRAGHYRAIFTVSAPGKAARSGTAPKGGSMAYIDPGSKVLGHLLDTDGNSVEMANTPGLADLDRAIDRIKSKRDRCEKRSSLVQFTRDDGSVHKHWDPSPRWKRLDNALKRVEMVKRDRIKLHLFTLGHSLFRAYDTVGIGDWTPANADAKLGTGRRRRRANRTLRNTRHLGRLREVLSWIATRSGKRFIVMDESGTTRTCADCGHVVAGGLHPRIREWSCDGCGSVHLRDENASRNGLGRLAATAASVHGNIQVPRSGHRAQARCRLVFRSDGRWDVGPFGPGTTMNSIVVPELTGMVAVLNRGGRGSQRPKSALS